ncbi:hypothetical protein [Vibrio sp. VPAP30]|uniref:hypothetical protein n=1 Tax=Vibrio sp. VPAP30 TaxID=1647102 RepID=UPI0006585F90|nr:hypothetical protein [Vibrio sp. VPAP30]KLN66349.1 hypothetical protein ZX61_05630 [Vibrio sp. VPAP30]
MPIACEYPIPKNWQDFERMLQDLHPELTLYGRHGQDQDGIDLVSHDGSHALQAKKRGLEVQHITIQHLSSWVERAKAFYEEVSFERLILATTQKRDKNLQAALLKHIKSNDDIPFQVEILFWDSIEELLIQRPELVRKYYATVLYDPIVIRQFQLGSLDTYIETTLLSSLVSKHYPQGWPSIDLLVQDLPTRLSSGFGHEMRLTTLKEDLQPLYEWCYRILVEARANEKFINNIFSQPQILPLEWASSYVSQLRETDIVAVFETEMALLHWARKMISLIIKVQNVNDAVLLRGDIDFADKCEDAIQSLNALTSCIKLNAEALSAYKSLKSNLRNRGITEYLDTNHDSNYHLLGFYGYKPVAETFGSAGPGIKLFFEPLEQIGVRAWVILEGTEFENALQMGKRYLKPLPDCSHIRILVLGSN